MTTTRRGAVHHGACDVTARRSPSLVELVLTVAILPWALALAAAEAVWRSWGRT